MHSTPHPLPLSPYRGEGRGKFPFKALAPACRGEGGAQRRVRGALASQRYFHDRPVKNADLKGLRQPRTV